MRTLALEDAQHDLRSLVRDIAADEPILLTDGGRPVAQISAVGPQSVSPQPTCGTSLLDHEPWRSGQPRRPYPHPDDDILGEMLEGKPYDGTPRSYDE